MQRHAPAARAANSHAIASTAQATQMAARGATRGTSCHPARRCQAQHASVRPKQGRQPHCIRGPSSREPCTHTHGDNKGRREHAEASSRRQVKGASGHRKPATQAKHPSGTPRAVRTATAHTSAIACTCGRRRHTRGLIGHGSRQHGRARASGRIGQKAPRTRGSSRQQACRHERCTCNNESSQAAPRAV